MPALTLGLDELFITASTSEAYSLLFALLTEPGDNVLGPQVTYPLFEYLAAYHHVELRAYALDEARGWAIDKDDLRAQADERTRAVLLVSPHNPTGHVVQSALPVLMELGVPVICDEVFAEFPYAIAAVPPVGALMPDVPVFTLNGISKLFALPDMKLGWIALTGPRAARARYGPRLELLNDTFLGANSLVQAMLPALFAQGDGFRAEMRARVRANIDLGLARLSASARVRVQSPEGGYYLFPEILDCADEEALVIDLIRRGVLVYPGYFFNVEEGAHLMLACLAEPEAFAEGVARVVAGLS
jgi:aspartate/methionine/tyrosine aminotransferase